MDNINTLKSQLANIETLLSVQAKRLQAIKTEEHNVTNEVNDLQRIKNELNIKINSLCIYNRILYFLNFNIYFLII